MSQIYKAFSPGGITSFFDICDETPEGYPISNELEIGARGGGFVINKGVMTEIKIKIPGDGGPA